MTYPSFHYWVIDNIPFGSKILEFGSGEGTKLLTPHFKVTSIEHDLNYLNLVPDTKYIYAEFIDGWYNTSKLQGLRDRFDAIIIDAPPGHLGREGILKHLNLFDFNTTLIVDDVNRKPEMVIFKHFATGREWEIFEGEDRSFGIVY